MATRISIYLTGNQWHQTIQTILIDVDEGFGMKDYNSSDVILQYGKSIYLWNIFKEETILLVQITNHELITPFLKVLRIFYVTKGECR